MTKETVPLDDAGDNAAKAAYNDFPAFARIYMDSEQWRERQVVTCGYSCVGTVNLNVPTNRRVEFVKYRPNCVVMSERLLTLLCGKLPEKSRRFRPFGVRRLRTKVRVKP